MSNSYKVNLNSPFIKEFSQYDGYIIDYCENSPNVEITSLSNTQLWQECEFVAVECLKNKSIESIDRALWAIDYEIIRSQLMLFEIKLATDDVIPVDLGISETRIHDQFSKSPGFYSSLYGGLPLLNMDLSNFESKDAQKELIKSLVVELNGLTPSSISTNLHVQPNQLYPGALKLPFLNMMRASGKTPTEVLGLDNFSWPECYAVQLIALVYIAKYLSHESITGKIVLRPDQSTAADLIGELLARAFEIRTLLTMSELAKEPEGLANHVAMAANSVKERLSKTKAAQMKNAPGNKIKEGFIEWYSTQLKQSIPFRKGDAAQHYIDKIMSDRDRSFISNPRTLVAAWNKHINQ
ncbi:hypothetical protein [Bacterioplanoides sp. SCSIO 12839]|uniref:hypothetical protein n=1 Tax=Bacterioplanoides sp. SCSIO 12839 TaxID=2829569 RepID=UPI002106ED38|nr:hypothetical protein [Bacterioplanoides sp. SCSIO 12839]UTW46763.1 hypothetical protein KFF03_09060 [Bacterioplanoides sp. SCSIO 12839]